MIKGDRILKWSNNKPPILAMIKIPTAPKRQLTPITDPRIEHEQDLFTITYPTVINP